MIEAITQIDLARHVDQQVFQPPGTLDSSLVWRDDFETRAVSGRTTLGTQQRVQFRYAVSAASMYTTAADDARFMSALLADPSILSMTGARPIEVDGQLGLQWGNNPGFRAFAMASVTSKDGFGVRPARFEG